MKGDGKAACCGAGNCKEGAGCCGAKKGETVAMACCSGNHCERHKLSDADNVAR